MGAPVRANGGTVDEVWHEQDTTPARIDDALRSMLAEIHRGNSLYFPARVLNLVAIVDQQYSGEIANRLRGVGRYHASRTIVCQVERDRTHLDAVATIKAPADVDATGLGLLRETVIVSCGPQHLGKLDRIVDPLVVSELPTCVWAPHGHDEGVDALLPLTDVELVDSADETDPAVAMARIEQLAAESYVVDLSWLRSVPWRERIAATFDPLPLRGQLRLFSALELRIHPESTVAALLYAGWLASRLDWRTSPLIRQGDRLEGTASARRQEVGIAIVPDPKLTVRGFSGLTLETAAGRRLTLDRGAGGLRAHYSHPRGTEREWTIFGASRGEPGILGEGLRQALLRDPTYRPALNAAAAMLPH